VSSYGKGCKIVPNESLKVHVSVLEDELSSANYKEWFRTLLYMEENRRSELLKERCNGYYKIRILMTNESCKGFLTPNEENKMDVESFGTVSEYAADFAWTVRITFNNGETIDGFDLHLHHNEQYGVCIALLIHERDVRRALRTLAQSNIEKFQFDAEVKFHLNRRYFELLHESVEALSKETILKVFPETNICGVLAKKKLPDYEPPHQLKLDEMFQTPALEMILSNPPLAPFILTGPFGTGKTRLIVRATHQIVCTDPGASILICVHHNQTANNYIEDYFGRLYESGNIPRHAYPVRMVPQPKKIPPHTKYYRHYYLPEQLRDEIQECQLVITTYTVAKILVERLKCKPGFFTHIFLDEAAQGPEPEVMMPLLLAAKDTHILLAGDHLQSGPQDDTRDVHARVKGLSTSLLQRLHRLYYHSTDDSVLKNKFMATLLTNYRSHEAILRLPSNLFYECSLLTRSKDSSPHPDAPYPLMFVCTSLERAQSNRNSWNEAEVKTILEVAEKYLKTWPARWGSFSADQVCLMARTHQQQSYLRKMMEKSYYHSKRIRPSQVRVTFAIQGLEFRVVFVNTSEPCQYTAGGNLVSPTDLGTTVVNERVFNTMLTRAKSLFVAFGNPHYLMDAEECMVQDEHQDTYCWKEYLKTCASWNAIVYPSSSTKEQQGELQDRIFHEREHFASDSSKREDSILLKSKEEIRKRLLQWLKGRRVELHKGSWSLVQADKKAVVDEQEDLRFLAGGKEDIGLLHCTKVDQAEVTPVGRKGTTYKILGIDSRRGALHGALVKVRPTVAVRNDEGSPPLPPLGKVIDVIRQGPHETFFCKMDPNNSNYMIPLDGKNPKFVNLPRIARLLESNEKMSLANAVMKQGSVACFDRQSLIEDDTPRLRDVIPLDDAKKMKFRVLYISWKRKYMFPLGAVIEAYPPNHPVTLCEDGELNGPKVTEIRRDSTEYDYGWEANSSPWQSDGY
jgi:hypothetical protein